MDSRSQCQLVSWSGFVIISILNRCDWGRVSEIEYICNNKLYTCCIRLVFEPSNNTRDKIVAVVISCSRTGNINWAAPHALMRWAFLQSLLFLLLYMGALRAAPPRWAGNHRRLLHGRQRALEAPPAGPRFPGVVGRVRRQQAMAQRRPAAYSIHDAHVRSSPAQLSTPCGTMLFLQITNDDGYICTYTAKNLIRPKTRSRSSSRSCTSLRLRLPTYTPWSGWATAIWTHW